MRRILKFILVFCFILGGFIAQGGTLSEKEKTQVIASISKSVASMKSMSASFTQTKHLSLLKDKMVSEGKMYYKSPGKLRWEYTSPYSYCFVMNGNQVSITNKNRKDVINTSNNRMFREIARIMMETVTGTALSNSSDFTISISSEDAKYVVTLLPKKKDMKRMFSKIVLQFNRQGNMISEIDLYEKNGDRTNIRLKNQTLNRALNESLFTIRK